jgi:hypothetical protein
VRDRAIVILVLALVVIIGSVVSGLLITTNQRTSQNAHATATAYTQQIVAASSYPFSKKLLLSDPLADNSQGLNWDNDGKYCYFSGNVYHTYDNQTNSYQPCSALKADYSDFTMEVQMTIKQGGQLAAGGLIIRGDESKYKYYHFTVDSAGYYYLLLSVDATGANANERILGKGTTRHLTTGMGQTNLLAVVAQGEQLAFYVNKQLVATARDSTYTHGQIGLEADYGDGPSEVVYTHLKIWQLG